MTGAGVAGFIKVMLALKNRMLPPSINFESVNEHISLKDSPFYVNNRLKPWEVPDGVPRSACVSAFGFSGTNAHIVVEEYIPADAAFKVPVQVGRDKALLFVLSAKTKEQLKKYAVSVKDFVRLKESLNLEDLAYTLQVGRETMDHRLAFRFDSREELINSLDAFANGVLTENIHTAYVIRNKDGKADFGEADEDVPEVSVLKKDLSKLARMWVKGADIDWQLLYGETNPQRISLPTYPFSKERFWVPVKEPQSGYRKAARN
jgi:polyketide synthase PksM